MSKQAQAGASPAPVQQRGQDEGLRERKEPLYPLLMPVRAGVGWEGCHTDSGEPVGARVVTAELIQFPTDPI